MRAQIIPVTKNLNLLPTKKRDAGWNSMAEKQESKEMVA